MHTAVMIMAKVPQAGAVKTRLCPPLSPQEAMLLYHAFFRDKIARVPSLAYSAIFPGAYMGWP